MPPQPRQPIDEAWLSDLEERSNRADAQELIQDAIRRGEIRVVPGREGRVHIVFKRPLPTAGNHVGRPLEAG